MEVFIRDEDMCESCFNCPCHNGESEKCDNYCNISGDSIYGGRLSDCPLKSLKQHDLEIRADERKKVVEELEKLKDIVMLYFFNTKVPEIKAIYDRLEQKLTELKGD